MDNFDLKKYLAEGKLLNESTRGQFGKIDKSGKITSVYTHSDSQPSRIRPLIKNYYNQGQGIDTILRRGDNSALEKDAGNMSFYNAKDLGHSGDIEDIQKYVEVVKNRGTEYIYLFDERDSKWYMFDVYGDNELYPMGGMVVNEEIYDTVRDIKSAMGTGNSQSSVEDYLGYRLSGELIKALKSARVIR